MPWGALPTMESTVYEKPSTGAYDSKEVADAEAERLLHTNIYQNSVSDIEYCNVFKNKKAIQTLSYTSLVEFLLSYADLTLIDRSLPLIDKIERASTLEQLTSEIKRFMRPIEQDLEDPKNVVAKDFIDALVNEFCSGKDPDASIKGSHRICVRNFLILSTYLGLFGNKLTKIEPLNIKGLNSTGYIGKYIDRIIKKNDTNARLSKNPNKETQELIEYLFLFVDNKYTGTCNGRIPDELTADLNSKKLTYSVDSIFAVKDGSKIEKYNSINKGITDVIIKSNGFSYEMFDPGYLHPKSKSDPEFSELKVFKTENLHDFFPSYESVKPYFVVYKLKNITG